MLYGVGTKGIPSQQKRALPRALFCVLCVFVQMVYCLRGNYSMNIFEKRKERSSKSISRREGESSDLSTESFKDLDIAATFGAEEAIKTMMKEGGLSRDMVLGTLEFDDLKQEAWAALMGEYHRGSGDVAFTKDADHLAEIARKAALKHLRADGIERALS